MKKYTAKPNEDLGSIARKFGIPSWKYLYQLNKDTIGDNPDLLKPGTVLDMPEWDSTSGDEKLKAKEIEPEQWTGSAGWRYPWVALSVTLTKESGEVKPDFEKERELLIRNRKSGETILKEKIKVSDSFERLVPDTPDLSIGIEGYPIERDGELHYHPNDEF